MSSFKNKYFIFLVTLIPEPSQHGSTVKTDINNNKKEPSVSMNNNSSEQQQQQPTLVKKG
jgi:hypothetical protein